MQVICKGKHIQAAADFSIETFKFKELGTKYSKFEMFKDNKLDYCIQRYYMHC